MYSIWLSDPQFKRISYGHLQIVRLSGEKQVSGWLYLKNSAYKYSFFLHFIWRLWGTDSKKGEVFEKSMAFLKYVCFNINILVINPSKKTGFDKPVK